VSFFYSFWSTLTEMNPSFESANYVAERKPGGLVYLIGYESLYQELMRVGMQVYHAVERQPKKADFLLVGNDSQIGMDKFTCALRVLQNGAEFVAVNQDPTVPSSDGFTPGTGALVGAISTMIGRKPDVCIGKSSPLLLHRAVADLDVYPWECIMIGGTLESDIVAGRSFSAYAVLVSTGNVNRVYCSAAASMVPDKIVNSLEELL
jgi:ribonucleotide monophosphatase NagD (HAD superfamily)